MISSDYIKSFVIASSLPVFAFFFYYVYHTTKYSNIVYWKYTLAAPLYFGIMNVLSLYLSKKYNWSLSKRLFIISQISAFFIIFYITSNKIWKFKTKERWYLQYVLAYTVHYVAFNIIIKNITRKFI